MNYVEKVWDTFIRAYRGDLQAQAEILYVDAMLNGANRLIKEEKKMQNVDKYREAILCGVVDIDRLDCHIAALRGAGAVACANGLCRMCMRESFHWLFSEHEPQLLENGDGLKPGDCIMVKNCGDTIWRKRQFLCMYDDMFIVSGEGGHLPHGMHSGWEQARLPEDSE